MSAKSLKRSGSLLNDRNRKPVVGGRVAERHTRSVHREACRPQGVRSPLRQFSLVRSEVTGDDGFNVRGSQHCTDRKGEICAGLPGFEVVACMQRSVIELGRPVRLLDRGRLGQLNGDPSNGLIKRQESDPLIVLGDGNADHMGKRRAGGTIEQSTHDPELLTRTNRVKLPAQSRYCAFLQRSLMRENRT